MFFFGNGAFQIAHFCSKSELIDFSNANTISDNYIKLHVEPEQSSRIISRKLNSFIPVLQ